MAILKAIKTINISNITISLGLDMRTQKKDGESGEYSMAVKVAYMGKMYYHRTGQKVTLEQYDALQISRGKTGTIAEILKQQTAVWLKVCEKVRELDTADDFSFHSLKDALIGRDKKEYQTFNERWAQLIKDTPKARTAAAYKDAYNSFCKYVGTVSFLHTGYNTFNKWITGMQADGKRDATIGMYCRASKVCLNLCVKEGLIKANQYPFCRTNTKEADKIMIPKSAKRKEDFLTVSEILKMYGYKDIEGIKDNPAKRLQIEATDIFMLCYFCNGCNLIDLIQLRWNKHYFQSGEKALYFSRTKTAGRTDMIIPIPIIPELRVMLDRLATKPKEGALLFPLLLLDAQTDKDIMDRTKCLNNTMSTRMKAVAKELGIPKPIAMSYARHSFSTNLSQNDVPERWIEQAMGHVDNSVADNYKGGYSITKMMRFNSMLLTPEDEE